jgi:outer membrane protein OmpA-like peptidoglycan-associated protein
MRAIARMSAVALVMMMSAAPAYAQSPEEDETEAFIARCQLLNQCEEEAPAAEQDAGSQDNEVADGTPRRPRTRGHLDPVTVERSRPRAAAERPRATIRRTTRSAAALRRREAARAAARANPRRAEPQFLFQPGSAVLTRTGMQRAWIWGREIARGAAGQSVQLVGHTDASGDADANRVLSEARARAVASVFMEAGVAANRIAVIGRGEEEAMRGRTPYNSRHRRVEVIMN